MRWWVYQPAHRLALPAEVPRLDLEGAIGRGWHMSLRRDTFPRAWLLLPDPPVFLPTYPLPGYRHPEWHMFDAEPVSPGYLRGYRAVVPLLPP